MSSVWSAIARFIRPQLKAWLSCGLGVIMMVTLGGCVDYNVGINFNSPHGGVICHHIQLDGLGKSAAQSWLAQVESRAHTVQGHVDRSRENDVEMTIPFVNGRDLERKFNQFFAGQADSVIPDFASMLRVEQSNWLLVEREHLIWDVDLTDLSVPSIALGQSNLEELFKLNVQITGPWTGTANAAKWTLQPGQKNHLEATLWMPMPLGWGSVVIGLVVWIGLRLRRQ